MCIEYVKLIRCYSANSIRDRDNAPHTKSGSMATIFDTAIADLNVLDQVDKQTSPTVKYSSVLILLNRFDPPSAMHLADFARDRLSKPAKDFDCRIIVVWLAVYASDPVMLHPAAMIKPTI